jgi:hypothetical protein
MGMEVFKSISFEAPLIVAVAVWQYSYHVLAGWGSSRSHLDNRQLGRTVAQIGRLIESKWLIDENGFRIEHSFQMKQPV